MNPSQFRLRQFLPTPLWTTMVTCAWMTLAASAAWAQLAPNQTNGFGNGRLVTFTYLQNFDCVDEPTLDLDHNGIMAQSDPNEMQTPICQPVTETSADPSGRRAYCASLCAGANVRYRHKPWRCDAVSERRAPRRTLRRRARDRVDQPVRSRPRSMESHSERRDAVSRPEQSCTRNLHDACLLGGLVGLARRDAGHPQSSDRARFPANTKS